MKTERTLNKLNDIPYWSDFQLYNWKKVQIKLTVSPIICNNNNIKKYLRRALLLSVELIDTVDDAL